MGEIFVEPLSDRFRLAVQNEMAERQMLDHQFISRLTIEGQERVFFRLPYKLLEQFKGLGFRRGTDFRFTRRRSVSHPDVLTSMKRRKLVVPASHVTRPTHARRRAH